MKKKNVRVWTIENDDNWVWFSDGLTGGLYRYHRLTGETKCEIDPVDLYKQNIFRIAGIVCWKEYVVLCPLSVRQPIAVFSKLTGRVKTVPIFGIEKYTHLGNLDGAREINNVLYLNLYRSKVAVLAIELDKLCDFQVKEILPRIICYSDNNVHTVWLAKCFANTIYLPVQEEKIIYKVKNNEITYMNAEIPKNIFTICFYESEIWVLSDDGREAYRLDLDGKLQEVISIQQDDIPLEMGAHNIIVTGNYIFFMLPKYSIICCDKKTHCTVRLNLPDKDIENLCPNEMSGGFFLGMEKNDELLLFPNGNRGLRIDLLTLGCSFVDFFFPDTIEKKIEYCEAFALAHIEGSMFSESRPKSLDVFLKFIESGNVLEPSEGNLKAGIGEGIYRTLKEM